MHVPHSPGTQSDDRLLKTLDHLLGVEVVITEKRDGENTSLYSNHMHARSLDSKHHESRNYFEAFSVWNERNERLHWDEQAAFLASIWVKVVPQLYRGPLTMDVLASSTSNGVKATSSRR